VKELVEILLYVAIIVVFACPTIVLVTSWELEPWWRKFPKPRKQLENDRELIKVYELRQQYPEVFADEPLPEQGKLYDASKQ
jgi:hypothetical protein